MTLKECFAIICLLLIKTCYSQQSVLKTESENSLFNCDYEIYTFKTDFSEPPLNRVNTVVIDTFNVCRVQKAKIKRLTIYYFKDSTDSILFQDIEYKTNGLIQNMTPITGWFIYADINPDTVNIDCSNVKTNTLNILNRDEKKIDNEKSLREIYKYDSLGYIIERTEIVKGVFKRWMYRTIGGGNVKYQTFYNYKNNYKTVTISHCYKKRIKSKECSELYYNYIICEFNDTKNIVSELKYRQDSNGKTVFVDGFKYYYSYFDIK